MTAAHVLLAVRITGIAAALAAGWWLYGRLRPLRRCFWCRGRGEFRLFGLVPVECPACRGSARRFSVPARIVHKRK